MAQAKFEPTYSSSNPRWLAEPGVRKNRPYFPAKVDASQFVDRDAVTIAASANAAQNATTITVTAATLPFGISKIPAGTYLVFSGTKPAKLTLDYTGGTTLTVTALAQAINSGESATFLPFGARVYIPSGTLLGRTYAERASETPFGPAANNDDEVFLTIYDVQDATLNNDVELLQHLATVKENFIPNFATLSQNAWWLTFLRTKYRTILGRD